MLSRLTSSICREPGASEKRSLPIFLIVFFSALWVGAAMVFPGFMKGDEVETLNVALDVSGRTEYDPWPIRHLLVGHVVGGWLSLWPQTLEPPTLLLLAALPFIIGSVTTLLLIRALNQRLSVGVAAALPMVLYGIHWVPLTYGTSPFPRAMTTPLIVASCLLVLSRSGRVLHVLIAGALIGLAGASRYSEWIYIVPLASLIWWEVKGLRPVLSAAVGFLFGAGILLLYDWWAWGSPGASLLAFLDYTFVERRSSSLQPHQPLWWYIGRAHQILAPPLWPFLWFATKEDRVRRTLILFGGVPLLILTLVHHKEVRYLQAVLPFLVIAVAAGACTALRGPRKRFYATLLILGIAWSLIQFREVTKRSGEPLEAAAIVARRDPPCVALAQPWRYGHRLYFPDAEIIDLSPDAASDRIADALTRCDYAVIFEGMLRPELESTLRDSGIIPLERLPMKRPDSLVILGPRP